MEGLSAEVVVESSVGLEEAGEAPAVSYTDQVESEYMIPSQDEPFSKQQTLPGSYSGRWRLRR